jgi:Protein of unknown function (DUF3987)
MSEAVDIPLYNHLQRNPIVFSFGDPDANGKFPATARSGDAVLATATINAASPAENKEFILDAARQLPVGEFTERYEAVYDSLDLAVRRLPKSLFSANGTHKSTENKSTPAVPTPREIISAKPFPAQVLPGAVGEFVCEAAAAIGCAVSFVALPMLACLARAIGNKRVIRLKQSWCEPAILWCAIVGKSGTHKSPALAAATAILNRKQAEAIEHFQEALQTYERDKALFERDIAQWRRDKKSRSEPPPVAPQEPAIHRFIISDATMEAVACLLHQQPNGDSNLLVVRDELAGWVNGIGEYKGKQNSDCGHWLSTWNAAPLTVDRKTGAIRTVHVPRAGVSIVGGIQPGVLRSGIAREHMQDGLCARLLLAMPEPKPIHWTEATVSPSTEAALEKVFDKLLALEPAADANGKPEPFAMPLTPQAKTLWVDYYNRHRAELSNLDDDLAAAWSKLEAYAARFALIFQLCANAAGEANDDSVDEESIKAGIELADWFGTEAKRVYGLMVETDAEREHRQLVELIQRKGGRITARELTHASRQYRAAGEAEAALERLVKAGIGGWEVEPTTRRPKTLFVLHGNSGNGNTIADFPDENAIPLPLPVLPRDGNGHDDDAINRLLSESAEDAE